VRRVAPRAAQALVLPAAALALALALAPGRAGLWAHLFLVALLAVALGAALALLRAWGPPGPGLVEAALARPERLHERLPELARLEREVALAGGSAFDVHYRLRPVLREVAAGLLAARRGVLLDRDPARARALLGEEAWELVRADREPPRDRHGPGIPPDRLARVVDALESVR
jgi:hypothetical protein